MDFLKKRNYKNLKLLVDNFIKKYIESEKNPKLKEIMTHSLMGGKRIRPIISLIVFYKFMEDKEYCKDILSKIVIIPEIIHNISLIIDDLPCMDNDNYRRDKETTHFKYGLIPSYITIIKIINNLMIDLRGFVKFDTRINFKNQKGRIVTKNYHELLNNEVFTQIETLIEGQYYDLSFLNLDLDLEILYKINSKKTAPLFSLSFVLGYLQIIIFEPEYIIDENILISLSNLGELFGLIFQLNDDIVDREEDLKENKNLNLSLHLGEQESIKIFNDKCFEFQMNLEKLDLWNDNFKEIILLLKKRIVKK